MQSCLHAHKRAGAGLFVCDVCLTLLTYAAATWMFCDAGHGSPGYVDYERNRVTPGRADQDERPLCQDV